MIVREFHRKTERARETGGNLAVLAPRRERLAVVSTRNELCGIAAYTQALERQLSDIFDVTVFDLDQYLLRGRHSRVRALGDRHIKEICGAIADFDTVNVQLEFGTLGRSAQDICRRFSWLVAASPRLSVTFHTFKRPPIFPWEEFSTSVFSLRWREAAKVYSIYVREWMLSLRVIDCIRRAQHRKPVSVIVHNRRDASDARHLYNLERVFDHPLAFLSPPEITAIKTQTTRRRFPLLDRLPEKAMLIGVFGFLNNYKGFGTVIRALYHLPAHHHLLIFGGIHPNEIQMKNPIHPYIASLLRDGHIDATLYEQLMASPNKGATLALDIERHVTELLAAHPRDLSDRVHFMGTPDDADFLAGMAICDAVVFPYLEVGQSSSGPISQAVELGCRVIASRTQTFLQFARYHPNTIEFFDIGNHLELAGRIAARAQYARRDAPQFNSETNKAIYLAANSAASAAATRFRLRRAVARLIDPSVARGN